MKLEAYCVKCRTKQPMQRARKVTMKNGKPAYLGHCPVCDTKMYRVSKAGDDFHREGEPDIVDIPRNAANLTTVEAEFDRAMATEYKKYTNTMRVSIICPRCVRTVQQYMLTKGEHACIAVPICPYCDEGKEDVA